MGWTRARMVVFSVLLAAAWPAAAETVDEEPYVAEVQAAFKRLPPIAIVEAAELDGDVGSASDERAGTELEAQIEAAAPEILALARQLAEVPGSVLSDVVLLLLLREPVGAIAKTDPSELPGAPSDATAAGIFLSMDHVGRDELRDLAEDELLAEAGNNAYYAIALLEYAHFTKKDPALAARALELGAGAPGYAAPYTELLDGLAARTPPEAGDQAVPAHLRALGIADFFATSGKGGVVGLIAACREPPPDIRADCVRLATTVLAGAESVSEALTAAGMLDLLAGGRGSGVVGPRETAVRWLWVQSQEVAGDPAQFTDAVSQRFVALWRSQGELAARRFLLETGGIAPTPPAGWTQPKPGAGE